MFKLQLRSAADRTMPILSDHFGPAIPPVGCKLAIRKKRDMVKRVNYRVTEVEFVLCEDDSGLDEIFVYLTPAD